MTVTSGDSSASSSRGPSRSAMTTSASASSCLPRTGMRPRAPGAPPAQCPARDPGAVMPPGDRPGPQPRRDRVADGRAVPGVAAEHADAGVAGRSGGGRPGRRGGRVVGAHAPGAGRLSLRRHRAVHFRPVGAGDDQPGARAVAGGVLTAAPLDPAAGGKLLERGSDGRRDQDHVRAGHQQPRHPAGRYRSPAHHHHLPVAKPQAKQVRLVLPVVSSGHRFTCHGGRVPRTGLSSHLGSSARGRCHLSAINGGTGLMAEFEVFRHSVLSCSNRLLVLLEYQVFRYCRRYTDRHAGTAKPEPRGGSNVIHSDLADEAIDAEALRELATTYGERAVRLPPVALVIAAYNEEGAVGPVVESLPRTLCGLAAEVIVVADGCADATAKEAHEAGAIVANVPVNRGQGAALRLGYRIAREGGAAYIVTTDADGQYNPAEIPTLLQPILDGKADFVTGSRRLGSEETKDPVRKAGVRFFAALVSTLTGQKIGDTTFGLRAMRAEGTGAVQLEQPQYQASELLIGVIPHGYKLLEVPATIHKRAVGESKKGQNPLYNLHIPGLNNIFYGSRFMRVVLGTWWRESRRRNKRK